MDGTKPCPKCGEEIKAIAIRCKHCQADLGPAAAAPVAPVAPAPLPAPVAVVQVASTEIADFDRGDLKVVGDDFEQRFLDFAYRTTMVINATSVAYACKIPIAEADDKLEDLAARDVLIRDVDDKGLVSYQLPGKRKPAALVPVNPQPLAKKPEVSEATALVGLLLNLPFPGVGSLVVGRTREGFLQMILATLALPLCVVLVGFPMLFGVWIWALMTSIRVLNDAKTTTPA